MGTRYRAEVHIKSARKLKWDHGVLKTMVGAWIDDMDNKMCTSVDEEGDTTPKYDQHLTIPFDAELENATLYLEVLHAEPPDGADPCIGTAKLPLCDYTMNKGYDEELQVTADAFKPCGVIRVRVKLLEGEGESRDLEKEEEQGHEEDHAEGEDWS